ncbi:hypothetical protein NV379_00765 [Paenibacillus sp. N1-5-1-14]|uniref:hypothetical protein n=1 Tax=Paenibacillus radicibacter TaxID=2972488 RepID=UPI002158F625|nr:hypothetical protein [Paenibacillus radicibacter]MCR8641174.1 hypothetical protein [Paenibacillus radicibacter]
MKHYWRTTILVAVSVLCLGTYYTTVSGKKEDYRIQTISGNEQEAAKLAIDGRYLRDQISIRLSGMERKSKSFLEAKDYTEYYNDSLNQLAADHDSFMRGKRTNRGFVENDLIIGHVKMDTKSEKGTHNLEYEFTVSIYDKAQKKSTSFHVDVPKLLMNDRHGYFVDHVWLDGQTIKVITMERMNMPNKQEMHVYTFSLDSKTLVTDEIITPSAIQLNNISGNDRQDIKSQNRYMIYEGLDPVDSGDAYAYRELYVYDTVTAKLEMITDQKVRNLVHYRYLNLSINLTGDEAVITRFSESGDAEVIRYHLSDKKVIGEFTLKMDELRFQKNAVSRITVKEDRLYLLGYSKSSRNEQSNVLNIVDLSNGMIVYQGGIHSKNGESTNSNMYVDTIRFVK